MCVRACVITAKSDACLACPLPLGLEQRVRENMQDLIIDELKLVMKLGMNKLQIADEKGGLSLGEGGGGARQR